MANRWGDNEIVTDCILWGSKITADSDCSHDIKTNLLLGRKDMIMAPHSSTLAWKIPCMEEPGGLQSRGLRRVGHDWVTELNVFAFYMLSSLAIAFLPRSRCLLISWLQSPSVSDFGAPPKNKVCHCLHCFPIYWPWSDGTGCHDLSFLNVEI